MPGRVGRNRHRQHSNCPGLWKYQKQPNRTRLHTAMDVAARTLLTELVPSLVVTGSKDAYPSNHGFAVSAAHPKAVNHRADACVYDTTTGSASLDFAYMCAVTDT